MSTDIDVLIIGLGPAGATIASELSKMKEMDEFSILAIDKRKKPGYPVQCAEFMPSPIEMRTLMSDVVNSDEIFTFNEKYISQRTSKISFVSPDSYTLETDFDAYSINRGKWNSDLVLEAEKGNIKILRQHKAITMSKNNLLIAKDINRSEEVEINSKIIIGADGVNSVVARSTGLFEYRDTLNYVPCKEYLISGLSKNENFDPSRVFMYFGKNYAPGAYGWIIPKSEDSANVGCGIRKPMLDKGDKLGKVLSRMINDHPSASKMLKGGIVQTTIGGNVPVGLPFKKTVDTRSNSFLIGDACCQVVSSVGGGIPPSMVAGRIAANCIRNHLISGTSLEIYESEWRKQMYSMFKRAFKLRTFFDKISTGNDSRLNWYLRRLSSKNLENVVHQKIPALVHLGYPFIGLVNKVIR